MGRGLGKAVLGSKVERGLTLWAGFDQMFDLRHRLGLMINIYIPSMHSKFPLSIPDRGLTAVS